MGQRRILLALYLLTLFFIGMGYLAITPIFEGIDEYAHYSSMRQIAGTGTIPVLGASYIDQAYADYKGPLPYSHDLPPYDSGLTYAKFFNQPDLVAQYQKLYRERPVSAPFRPGIEKNWQAQHPPLYYMLLAPVVKATDSYSLVTQIFILRLVTLFFALAGVALGLLAAEKSRDAKQADQAIIGFFLYPVILPMFFPEFTRLNNDALCIFWVGCLAYLLAEWRRDTNSAKLPMAIGAIMGLGLLTKALFLPILAAFVVFLSTRLWREETAAARPRQLLNLLWILYPAVLIGGGWYAYNTINFGVLGGGNDSTVLTNQGGMIIGLSRHFSLHGLIVGLVSMFYSYSWGGTWSLVSPPFRYRIPLLGLLIWVGWIYVRRIRQRPITDFAWLPVWLLVLFTAGMFYHLLVGLAINGLPQTPGWYLHILMPFIAPAIGVGIYSLLQNRRTGLFAAGLLLYAVGFHIVTLWSQFSLFTGCATKADDLLYAFPNSIFCLDQIDVLTDRLSVLGSPLLAALGFSGGLACALLLAILWKKRPERAIA